MNGQELFTKEGKATLVFFCSKCRCTHRTRAEADDCCVCVACKNAPREQYRTLCSECKGVDDIRRHGAEQERVRSLFEKATEVTEYEYLWHEEKMYSDTEKIIDVCHGVRDVPEYVFIMKPVLFNGFSLDELLDSYNENVMCEDLDVTDCLTGLAELQTAFAEFNDDNVKTTVYWIVDETKKVKVQLEARRESND